jgi:class 3 adenylate cyclase
MINQDTKAKDIDSRAVGDQEFVGRRRELAEISSALDKLVAGVGSLFLLRGELGIGKTALCDEIERIAIPKGIRVLWARSWEESGVPPYWLWIQVLRSLEVSADLKTPAASAGPIGSYLVERALRRKPGRDEVGITQADRNIDPETGEHERFELFERVLSLLQKASQDSPLLFVFDDCHAADESSMALLRFVARHMRQFRIMLLVTYREEDAHRRASVQAHINALGREGLTISLGSLSREETVDFVQHSVGLRLGLASAAKLFESTEGNPFFLKEILRLVADATGRDDPREFLLENLPLPDQLEETIRLRLAPISPKTKELLHLAAVDGAQFELDALVALQASDERAIVLQLQEATQAGVILSLPKHNSHYRFTHGLFARCLYEEIPIDRRRDVHLQLASLLEKSSQTQSEALIARIAYHRLRALPSGDMATAIEFARKAAKQAASSLAYEDAARWYEEILRAVESQQRPRIDERCELQHGLAESLHRAGLFRQSRQNFEALVALARTSQKGEWLARAVLGIGLLPLTPGTADRTLNTLLEEALTAIGPSDSALRARLLALAAESMQWSDPGLRRVSIARESIAMARRVGDPLALEDCLYRSHVALSGPDTLEERLAISSEFVALAQKATAAGTALRAHYLRLRDTLETGPSNEVESEVDEYVRVADQFRQRHVGIAEAALAMRAMMRGRFDEAENLAMQALTLGQDRQDGMAPQAFAAQMTVIRREQGRISEIEPIIRGIVIQFPNLVLARCGLAFCCCEDKRLEDARFEFERLAASDFSAIARDVSWLPAHVLLAEVCVSLDDRDRAGTLHKLLVPYAHRNAALDMYAYYGPVAHYLGMLATVTKNLDEAETHFEDALRLSRTMDSRPWFARSQHFYARMLLSRSLENDLERAELLNGSSLAIAQSLKMKSLEGTAQELSLRFADLRVLKADDTRLVSSGRTLSTVLFIDMVDSTELAAKQGDKQWLQTLNHYLSVVRKGLSKFGGREINSAGDGLVAVFNQPGTAIVAAQDLMRALASLDLHARAGVHTGEFEWNGNDIAGLAVHIGARVGSLARGGEILVSSTVRELVVGSGITFLDRGCHSLKGVPGQWQVFQVESVPASLS